MEKDMKIKYLGTAAAEGFPAVFCNCEYCRKARELGGKNIRTRSQAIIDDELLIDLPADTYCHFLNNNISGHKIKNLLVTHAHSDHLYLSELQMRSVPYSHNMEALCLDIYAGQGAYDKILREYPKQRGFSVNLLKPFEKVSVGDYEVTPLPARHMLGTSAMFFVISGEKTVLYAHDTGYFFEEVFDYIEKEKLHFDLVSLDCTNVDIPISDEGTHMGIPNNERVLDRLEKIGAVNENTVKVINHFSHNATPLHELLEKRVEGKDLMVSFDGLEINF